MDISWTDVVGFSQASPVLSDSDQEAKLRSCAALIDSVLDEAHQNPEKLHLSELAELLNGLSSEDDLSQTCCCNVLTQLHNIVDLSEHLAEHFLNHEIVSCLLQLHNR